MLQHRGIGVGRRQRLLRRSRRPRPLRDDLRSLVQPAQLGEARGQYSRGAGVVLMHGRSGVTDRTLVVPCLIVRERQELEVHPELGIVRAQAHAPFNGRYGL